MIFATRLNAVGIDPANGRPVFEFPFGKRGPTVNAAAPLVFEEHLFLTSSYGVGAVLARLKETSAEIVWRKQDTMSSQYTTPVYHRGFLYGTDGREDIPGVVRRLVTAGAAITSVNIEIEDVEQVFVRLCKEQAS